MFVSYKNVRPHQILQKIRNKKTGFSESFSILSGEIFWFCGEMVSGINTNICMLIVLMSIEI